MDTFNRIVYYNEVTTWPALEYEVVEKKETTETQKKNCIKFESFT